MAAVLSAIAYLIFAVLDWLVITENVQLALALRILAGLPGSALIFGMTKTEYFKKRPHVIGWLGISTATLIYATLNIFCDTPSVYHSGYIFMLVFLFFLFPLNFGTSVAIGVVCTVAFAMIISIFREIGLGELLTIYSQYVVMLLAGGFSVHLVNMLRRNEFLSEMKIEKQKNKIS